MLRILPRFLMAIGLVVAIGSSASATPNCLKGHKPFNLAGDAISWSMTIWPGANCIQGLRWSYMQIESVSVAEQPKNGLLVLVGPGFRYFSDADFHGTDRFTLVVSGKNRHDTGKSTIEVTVSKAGTLISSVDVHKSEH